MEQPSQVANDLDYNIRNLMLFFNNIKNSTRYVPPVISIFCGKNTEIKEPFSYNILDIPFGCIYNCDQLKSFSYTMTDILKWHDAICYSILVQESGNTNENIYILSVHKSGISLTKNYILYNGNLNFVDNTFFENRFFCAELMKIFFTIKI